MIDQNKTNLMAFGVLFNFFMLGFVLYYCIKCAYDNNYKNAIFLLLFLGLVSISVTKYFFIFSMFFLFHPTANSTKIITIFNTFFSVFLWHVSLVSFALYRKMREEKTKEPNVEYHTDLDTDCTSAQPPSLV